MNWLDVLLLIAFVVALVQGLRNGLIKSVISLVGLVLGLFLAARLYVSFGAWLQGFISSQAVANVVAFAVILFAVLVVSGIIGSVVSGAASVIGLGWVDRLGGALFSVLVAAVVVASLLAVALKSDVTAGIESAVKGSFVASILLDRFPVVLSLLPEDFDRVRDVFR